MLEKEALMGVRGGFKKWSLVVDNSYQSARFGFQGKG